MGGIWSRLVPGGAVLPAVCSGRSRGRVWFRQGSQTAAQGVNILRRAFPIRTPGGQDGPWMSFLEGLEPLVNICCVDGKRGLKGTDLAPGS